MIKSLLSQANLSLFVFIGLSIRLMAVGASIGDSIALAALAGLIGWKMYLDDKKEAPINEQIKADIEELKLQINAVNSNLQMNKLRKF